MISIIGMIRLMSKIKRWSSKELTAKKLYEPFKAPDYNPTDLEQFKCLLEASDVEISCVDKRFEAKITHKRDIHNSLVIKVHLETDPEYSNHKYVYDYLLTYISKTKSRSYGSGKNDEIHRIEVSYDYNDEEILKHIYDILHILNHN
jgi:hypothetical protein